MNAPSREIADYLESLNIGQIGAASGWGIFLGDEPAAPNTTITVYDTGGTEPVIRAQIFNPTIQVRVRAHDYQEAYDKARQVRDALTQVVMQVLGDTYVIGIWMTTEIFNIGRDGNNRYRLTANFRLQTQPTTEATS